MRLPKKFIILLIFLILLTFLTFLILIFLIPIFLILRKSHTLLILLKLKFCLPFWNISTSKKNTKRRKRKKKKNHRFLFTWQNLNFHLKFMILFNNREIFQTKKQTNTLNFLPKKKLI